MRRAALGCLLALTGCDRVFGLDRGDPPPPPPPEWTVIVTGSEHTCGLHNDQTLWCWGENFTGQIGLPLTTIEALSPVQIGEGQWTALAAGSFHTCAISVGRELWCWGNNLDNAIGVDTFANPLPLTRVLDDVTAVTAGVLHTCAIRGDQTLWCWGNNSRGQLAIDPAMIVTTPRQVGGSRLWKTIVAGPSNTCGITSADELFCWGDNRNAQIAVPQTPTPQYSAPEQIEPGVTWTDVAVGSVHTCGLRADGTLRCSGFNGAGQIGGAADGTTVTITTGEPGRTWIRVFAGFQQTCALRDDSTLWCLGANTQGQLALDANTPRVTIPTQVTGGGETWTTISVGEAHLCGLDEAGLLWCVGTNGAGQLGDGAGGSRLTPSQVPGAWSSVAVGADSVCARDFPGGTLSCWGLNTSSQLGDSTTYGRESPMQITGGRIDDPITIGDSHTCSTRSAIDSTLTCWGANGSGQLGTGATSPPKSSPQLTSPPIASPVDLASGTHTCARSLDGSLRCWGPNTQGQLGYSADNNTHPTPNLVPGTWSDVAAGFQHTCGIVGNNVFCWGDNSLLQRGSTMLGLAFVAGGADRVILGSYHSCLRTSSTMSLQCWGANTDGQLGDGTLTNRAAPTPIPGFWEEIAAGQLHTCAKDFDNKLWCWGNNARGQLGDGTRTRHMVPTQVGTDGDWDDVAAGGSETCAIKADHSLWCWGANGNGQIGDGSAWSPTFVRIPP